MATRPREWNTVRLRREDWQRIINAVAYSPVPDTHELVVRLFVETGIDPETVTLAASPSDDVLTPAEWGLVISVLQDRRRARYDRIIAKIQKLLAIS